MRYLSLLSLIIITISGTFLLKVPGPISSARFTLRLSAAKKAFPLTSIICLNIFRISYIVKARFTGSPIGVENLSPDEIYVRRNGLQVIWVNTRRNLAKMIEALSSRNRSSRSQEKGSMGKCGAVVNCGDLAVSLGVDGSRPEPAASIINFVPGPVGPTFPTHGFQVTLWGAV
jgi:hypothetical protein